MTRRTFDKLAGAAALSGYRRAVSAPSDRLRVALIGAGGRGATCFGPPPPHRAWNSRPSAIPMRSVRAA